jgi:hypothetical protein
LVSSVCYKTNLLLLGPCSNNPQSWWMAVWRLATWNRVWLSRTYWKFKINGILKLCTKSRYLALYKKNVIAKSYSLETSLNRTIIRQKAVFFTWIPSAMHFARVWRLAITTTSNSASIRSQFLLLSFTDLN